MFRSPKTPYAGIIHLRLKGSHFCVSAVAPLFSARVRVIILVLFFRFVKCKMKATETKVLEAVISGKVKWDGNRPFETPVRFTMFPSGREQEYGTGYYMTVEVLGNENQKPIEVAHYDMRYIGTSDIKKASEIAAKEFWGKNLEEFKIVKTYRVE